LKTKLGIILRVILFFGALGGWWYQTQPRIAFTLWLIGLTFVLFVFFNSHFATQQKKLLLKIDIAVQKTISVVLLSIVYFGVLLPIALIRKALKQDGLDLGNSNSNSFWKARNSANDRPEAGRQPF